MRENETNPASSTSLAVASGVVRNRCVRHLQSEHPNPSAAGSIPHLAAMDARVHSGIGSGFLLAGQVAGDPLVEAAHGAAHVAVLTG